MSGDKTLLCFSDLSKSDELFKVLAHKYISVPSTPEVQENSIGIINIILFIIMTLFELSFFESLFEEQIE